ncbi:MAG: hypothetical protein HY231_18495 [Acidobacteria bacterium]|nr:hypothetical protein [Acidobacteriota bacterium]
MKQQENNHRRFGKFMVSLLAGWFLFLAIHLAAQEKPEMPPLPIDPTPLAQLLSATERAALTKETQPKKQVETYLRLSDTHLQAALAAINNDDHQTAERELDIYNKALSAAAKLGFASATERRKLAKKIEQTIYKQLRVLETIDRHFPAEREGFPEYAIKNAKLIRSKALNYSFDSGEVISDPDQAPANKPPQENQQANRDHDFSAVRRASFISAGYVRKAVQSSTDYMTEEEDDFIRQAQEPDLRIKVFMKIIDRRLKALINATPASEDKKAQQNKEDDDRKWGALPKLDRAGLLKHYSLAIEEAMAKLDDAYERNPKALAFVKALKNLLESTAEQLKILHRLENSMTTEQEKANLAEAIEKANRAHQGAADGLKAK